MVMPLYDDNPFRLPHRPIVTWSLIGVNFLVFLLSGGQSGEAAYYFGLTPAALHGDVSLDGGVAPALTLVSYMFLHADIVHILSNMIFLWVFGDDVEEAMGRRRFLAFYLLCGIIGALAFFATDVHSRTPLIGASGAICWRGRRLCDAAALRQGHGAGVWHSHAHQRLLDDRCLRLHAVHQSGRGLGERRRLLVPCRRHGGRRSSCSR